jgi:hypothetical protein
MEIWVVYLLAVLNIYYLYRVYMRWRARTRNKLGQRVAYMLWVASNQPRVQ